MKYLDILLAYKVAGIPLELLLLSFVIIFATFFTRRHIVKRLLASMEKAAANSSLSWDEALVDTVKPPLSLGILVIGLWFALSILPLPHKPLDFEYAVQQAGRIGILLLVAWIFIRSISVVEQVIKEKAADPKHWMDSSLVPLIVLSLKTLVVIAMFVVIAQNLGYSVSGLVASLGIGGIAVALAVRDTLANFFGSLVVMIDKPFRIGDWVKSDSFEGVVEQIGFRSTRIRTFEKTVQVVPNDQIANVMLENMDRRKDPGLNVRRVKMTVGLEYGTSAEKMSEAVEAIKEILRTNPRVDQKFFLVNFTDFGAYSLDIFVYYFANTAKWEDYLEIRQEVNLLIMRKLESMGLGFAFPTQSIHVEKFPGKTFPDPNAG